MNILEQLRKAQAKQRAIETDPGVATIGELEMGACFEFGTTDELSVGNTVKIRRQYQWIAYGWALVTKDLGGGFYEAERIK